MLLPVKDFAIAVDVKPATLRQHLKRKKIFRSGKFIDTDFEPNREYIADQTDGKGLNMDLIPKGSPSKSKKAKPIGPKVEGKDHSDDVQKPKTEAYDTITMQKKAAELEKIKQDIEFRQLQTRRFRGEFMPVDLVQKILTVNVRTIFHNFETEAENVASVYCEILGGNREKLTEMTMRMREMLQKSIAQVKEKSAKDIKEVIKDYDQMKVKGIRK